MNEIAVAEILRSYGKWIRIEDFINLVSEKRTVRERQAYNLIKEAFKRKEILKHLLSDRTTLYGLAEFGPPNYKINIDIGQPNIVNEYRILNPDMLQLYQQLQAAEELAPRSKIMKR